jgi:hypothetical protein
MNTDFDYFVKNDLSQKNLNTFENLYFLIGTYPTLLDVSLYRDKFIRILHSLLFKLAFQKIIILLSKEPKDAKEMHQYNVNNSVFYFIDQNYDESYFKLTNEYLNSVFNPLSFEINIETNRMSILFSEINCRIYLLSLTIPTMYKFKYPSLPNLGKDVPEQMTYSIKCDRLSETWGLFLRNISVFLAHTTLKRIYILNDAIMFGRNIMNTIDNKNFEFFCELGYILNQLYLQGLGDRIYVYIPNNRQYADSFANIPEFNSLNDDYPYNYGHASIKLDGTKSNSAAQLELAEKGLDGRTVDEEFVDYETIKHTLMQYVTENYPGFSGQILDSMSNTP